MGIDAIIALASLVIPGAIDFVKKKWLSPESDTPEATMSTLATTKPDVLPAYIQATTAYMNAQKEFFNRDVVGAPSQWVIDLRAAIRPIGVVGAGLTLAGMVLASVMDIEIDPTMAGTLEGVRLSSVAIVSSWFGSRLDIHK